MGLSLSEMSKRFNPGSVKKGIKYLRNHGYKAFKVKLMDKFTVDTVPYGKWRKRTLLSKAELDKQRVTAFEKSPLISIVVPVYETPEEFLRYMVDSIIAQTYSKWELCIADGSKTNRIEAILNSYNDKRIKYKFLNGNLGIAGNSNAALEMATGEYVTLVDHDDAIEPDALFEAVMVINTNKQVDFIYTDEDKVNGNNTQYFDPAFKPDFSLDLLRSVNYICHMIFVKNEIIRKIGGFSDKYDGAQDYNLVFRIIEETDKIYHIPRILYHWRVHENSTASNQESKLYAFEAGKRAIEDHLKLHNIEAEVSHTENLGCYRVKYHLQSSDKVSVIIPNKDNTDVLDRCIKSVLKTKYENIEIVIVENNSTKEETFAYYEEAKKNPKVKVVVWEREFNYSAINNFGVANCDGEYILLLNNDVEFINDDWLEEMLSHCEREEVGIVGAKLFYPDDTVQHAGVIIGLGGVAGHAFVGLQKERTGYFNKASIQLNYSAVTAACLMTKRSIYEELGGLEERLAVAFNDIDFCLRVREKGYLVVYNPNVQAYHYESRTRGLEDTPEKVKRFNSEIDFMKERHKDILEKGDPYYNKNLSLTVRDYALKLTR